MTIQEEPFQVPAWHFRHKPGNNAAVKHAIFRVVSKDHPNVDAKSLTFARFAQKIVHYMGGAEAVFDDVKNNHAGKILDIVAKLQRGNSKAYKLESKDPMDRLRKLAGL
jgi:hypothetical protein